jgi:ribosomal protein L40E
VKTVLHILILALIYLLLIIIPLGDNLIGYDDLKREALLFRKDMDYLNRKGILTIENKSIFSIYHTKMTVHLSCGATNNGSRTQCRKCGLPINSLFEASSNETKIDYSFKELNLGYINNRDGVRTVYSELIYSIPNLLIFIISVLIISVLTMVITSIYTINKVVTKKYSKDRSSPGYFLIRLVNIFFRAGYEMLIVVPSILTILLIVVGIKGTSMQDNYTVYFLSFGIAFIVNSEFYFWLKQRMENSIHKEDVSYLQVIGYSKFQIAKYILERYCLLGIISRVSYAIITAFILESGLWYLRETGNLNSLSLYPHSIGKLLVQIIRYIGLQSGTGLIVTKELFFIILYYFLLFLAFFLTGLLLINQIKKKRGFYDSQS